MKSEIHHAQTIDEAINDLQVFFECDMWFACKNEWKSENDMIRYLESHFDVLRDEIKRINSSNSQPLEPGLGN